MGQVGIQHLLSLYFQSFQLIAFVEVLLLRQVVNQIIDALEAVLDLDKVRLDVAAGGEGNGAVPNGLELEGIDFPVVVAKLGDELFSLLVVHLGGI